MINNKLQTVTTNYLQIDYIRKIFEKAELQGIPLWLESGWAIDARLGRISREHADIDIAFPHSQRELFIKLLKEMGFANYEEMDYGFLLSKDGVLIDAEPCFLQINSHRFPDYNFPGFPSNSCPIEKEGMLEGFPVRCLSWEAMYVEFLGYKLEVPAHKWRAKDRVSLRLIEEHLTAERMLQIQAQYATQHLCSDD